MKKGYVSIVLILTIVLILLLHVNYLRFVCDDAFISFRYAKNFAQGHGLVYNIGEKVEGYTNFLWTLLLSLSAVIGLDVVAVSQALGLIFGLGTVLLLLRLNKKLYPTESPFDYLAPLLLVSCGAFAAWCTGGLETSIFTFLAFLGAFFFVSGLNQSQHFAFSGIGFALACLTRLDGLVLAGVTFVFLCYLTLVSNRTRPKDLWAWALAFSAPFLLYFIWRWSYYGAFLPNAFYVKVGGGSLVGQGLFYLFDFAKRFWIWLAIIPLFFLAQTGRLNARIKIVAWYFAAMITVFSFYVAYVGGDFMDMFRFLVPVLPCLFFLIQEGFRGIYHYSQPISLKRARQVSLIGAQILLVGLIIFRLAYPSRDSNRLWSRDGMDSIGMLREMARQWSGVGMMFKAMARPDESLATTAAGAIPYYSELYVIDQLGLTFPSHGELKDRQVKKPGHTKKVRDEYLLSLRPTYVLEHPTLCDDFERSRGVWRYSEIFLRNGYKTMVFPVSLSESETKYLYCYSLKESRSQKLDNSRFRVKRTKEGK